jgi:heat shock protein HslJ
LENTYWALTKVGDTVVPESHSPRRAHFILNAEAHRLGGSGGCNGILGKYELAGDQLTFHGVGATRMACKEGMETEKAFLDALNATRSWKMTERKLELVDGEGRTVAEFQTQPPKK